MARLPYLPYQPTPYPDEILGSWFARIALHNGPGGWISLLEGIGYGRGVINLTMFNMVNYDVRLERLLGVLGTSYEKALMELTTYPYWMVFDSADESHGVLPGTKALPKLAGKVTSAITSLARVNKTSSAHETRQIRFCPRCLREDHVVCGEPYWHRVHQLPGVFFCPEHQCALSTSCPRCNRSAVLIGFTLAVPPPLKCACGYNFTNPLQTEEPPPIYRELARFSASALNHKRVHWDQAHVHNYLRSEIASRYRFGVSPSKDIISRAFVVERATDQMLYLRVPGQGTNEHLWRLRSRISCGAAPESCALMAASGLQFTSFVRGLLALKKTPKLDLTRRCVALEALTVKSARRLLEEKMIRYPDWNPCNCTGPYWFLRINDAKWLSRRFPNSKPAPMPSIMADRHELLRIRQDTSLRRSQRDGRTTVISLRARMRDLDWYRKHDGRSNRPPRVVWTGVTAHTLAARTVRVRQALQDLLANEGRPRRIGRNELASASGLSCSQVVRVVLASDELKNAVNEVNAGKNRRLLRWAVIQILGEHQDPSYKNILRTAGLSATKGTDVIISSILNELSVRKR